MAGTVVDMARPGNSAVKVCPERYFFDQGFCHPAGGGQVVNPDLWQCTAGAERQAASSARFTRGARLIMAGTGAAVGAVTGHYTSNAAYTGAAIGAAVGYFLGVYSLR